MATRPQGSLIFKKTELFVVISKAFSFVRFSFSFQENYFKEQPILVVEK
jgi:hypothetical protein